MAVALKKLIACTALAASALGASAQPALLGLYLLDGNGNKAAGTGPDLTADGDGNISYVPGFSGQAASFDGSGANWLRADVDASGVNNPTFTWGAWIKLPDPNAVVLFLSNDKGGFGRFTGAFGGVWAASGGDWYFSSTATTSDWTLVAQTFSATGTQLFVNGAMILDLPSPNPDNHFHIDIGRNADGNLPLNGLMDTVFLFDEPLTPQQMTDVYNGGPDGSGVLQVAGLAAPVPEPGTMGLMALGLGAVCGLAGLRRRQNQLASVRRGLGVIQ